MVVEVLVGQLATCASMRSWDVSPRSLPQGALTWAWGGWTASAPRRCAHVSGPNRDIGEKRAAVATDNSAHQAGATYGVRKPAWCQDRRHRVASPSSPAAAFCDAGTARRLWLGSDYAGELPNPPGRYYYFPKLAAIDGFFCKDSESLLLSVALRGGVSQKCV